MHGDPSPELKRQNQVSDQADKEQSPWNVCYSTPKAKRRVQQHKKNNYLLVGKLPLGGELKS